MNSQTIANMVFHFPSTVPMFGAELYFRVQYMAGSPANGTEKTLTINGVSYKSVVINSNVYFYFDIKMANTTPFVPTTITAVYEGNSFSWQVFFGAGIKGRVRNFEEITFFQTSVYDFSMPIPSTYILYVQYFQNGLWYLSSKLSGYEALVLQLANATKISHMIIPSSATAPEPNDSRWSAPKEVHPICTKTGLTYNAPVGNKDKFKWIDRGGWIHTYYFDVIAVTEGKGKVTEYEKKRSEIGYDVHYTNSLGGYKITRTYLSVDEDEKGIKDLITLGSAMYLEINDIPVDTKLIGDLSLNTANKGLQSVTFSIVDELEDKNSILW
jgi:hypothetical protein